MSWRARLRRSGTALVIMGMVLSTFDVNPAGEISGALADETPMVAAPSASPARVASPEPAVSPAAPAPPEDALASPQAVAVGAAAKAPEGGDLTHLVFTATDGLVASLVDPADDEVASSISAGIEVETIKGAGVELKVGDAVVPFSRIGKRTVDMKTGTTRYTYYGVTLQPGPNIVTLTPLGAANARGPATVHRVYAPGRPVSLVVTGSGAFRADGASADRLEIEGRDAWGHRAASGSVVHVTLLQGDAHLERTSAGVAVAQPSAATPIPLASSSPGIAANVVIRQAVDVVLGSDGAATLRLVPGITPGAVVLRAECGDASRETRLFLAPNLRKPFVSGLVTAGAGAVPGIPDEADGEPDGTNSRRGRVALFGTGAVGKSLATFAYDTADTLQRSSTYGGALGTYQGDPDDKPYDTTGDTSLRRDDALSRDHLFARIDNGQSSAQWGEFRARTGTDTSTLGAFDQLVDGAKIDLGGATRHATVFAARNDVGYDRRVFAPTGLANGVTLRPDIVVGSEVVTLATLDARSGAIVTQSAMTRGVDYSIEYATGQLQFIDIPLPLDEAFNPREIIITYEFDAPGNTARTIGGRAETSFGANHAVKLGFGYVNDTSGAGNISMATEDLNGAITGGSWQIAHATSHGALLATSSDAPLAGNGGSALHAQLTRAVGADRLSLLYDRTDSGYYDPFGGLATPGLLNEHLTYAHKYSAGQGEIGVRVRSRGQRRRRNPGQHRDDGGAAHASHARQTGHRHRVARAAHRDQRRERPRVRAVDGQSHPVARRHAAADHAGRAHHAVRAARERVLDASLARRRLEGDAHARPEREPRANAQWRERRAADADRRSADVRSGQGRPRLPARALERVADRKFRRVDAGDYRRYRWDADDRGRVRAAARQRDDGRHVVSRRSHAQRRRRVRGDGRARTARAGEPQRRRVPAARNGDRRGRHERRRRFRSLRAVALLREPGEHVPSQRIGADADR